MDWVSLVREIVIALITTTLGSFWAYKKAIKESDNKIKEVEINAKTKLKEIQENSNKELAKIRAENEELRKNNESQTTLNLKEKEETAKLEMGMDMIKDILNKPDGMDKLDKLLQLQKMFPNNENKESTKN